MTRRGIHIGFVALALVGLSACSEVSNFPVPPVGPAAKSHPDGWLTSGSETFHGQAIRAAGWDMTECQSCHGADFAGGFVEVSCLTCHEDTPESCTTCHGTVGVGVAPPQDLSNSNSTTSLGVGAHQAHLTSTLAVPLGCDDCHVMPSAFADPSHIDGDGRAEITFGARAAINGATPTYDPTTGSCANTYCHGGSSFSLGNNAVWTDDGAACGTCHGAPPDPASTTHTKLALTAKCDACHRSVVEVDADDPGIIRIIAPELHINGSTDLNRPTGQ